jgi:hypothetical protein
MKLIELTKEKNGTPLFINSSLISAVTLNDGETNVYMNGDPIPFVVKEGKGEWTGEHPIMTYAKKSKSWSFAQATWNMN